MEDIQKLQQDNAKLQERLNNAAKFFREQKAQIEALTKENEELKRTPKEEVIDTEKWNALVTEKENLNKQLNEYELKLQKLESDIDSKDNAYKILQDTYNEVFAEKEKITKQYKEQEKFESDVINIKVTELEQKLQTLQQTHDDLGVDYDKLNAKYNELLKEKEKQVTINESLTQSLAKAESDLDIVRKSDQKYRKAFEEQKNQIEIFKTKFEEEEKNAVANKVLLDEANEKLDKLNKLYDDCENEKLAIQADYESLNTKFKNIELDTINKDEIIKAYKHELFNENICKYKKEDINNLCDYILDFFRDKKLDGVE